MTEPGETDPHVERAIRELRGLPAVTGAAREHLRAHIAAEALRLSKHDHARQRPGILLTPAHAITIAGLLVAAATFAWLGARQPAVRPRHDAAGPVPVQFVIVARKAERVSLVGDFNDWSPAATPLTASAGGLWSVVVPLERGRFSYSFLVDGKEWRADPQAPVQTDEFGRPSSVLYVAGPAN